MDTRGENDVVSVSRRHFVASTLIRGHFGTKCLLGYLTKLVASRLFFVLVKIDVLIQRV